MDNDSELKFSIHFFQYSAAEPLSTFSASCVLSGVAFNIIMLLKVCVTLLAQCWAWANIPCWGT